MWAALSALLLVAGHRDELARVLLRRTNVHQPDGALQSGKDLFAVCPDGGISGASGERLGQEARDIPRRGPTLGDPLLARTVHELHVVVPVVLQVPVRVGGEPVVAVPVEHDRVVVGEATRAEQLAERLRIQEVASHLVLEVLLPVKADGARDVRLRVEGGVLVNLDDADAVVIEVILHPLGADQDVVGIVAHVGASERKSGWFTPT